jgi:predicted RNA-binding Zn-ribbon protein involved in translation (DUF1610 family)
MLNKGNIIMEEKKQLKLCTNCNGQVDVDFDVCPYCGEEFSVKTASMEENPIENSNVKSLSTDETIASLYPPPYKPKSYDSPLEEIDEEEGQQQEERKEKIKKPLLMPILMFCFGVTLFLTAIFLLLFSKNNEVVLRWDARYWMLYLAFSLPLLFFGYKKLSSLDN